jgi:hypothetical protein
MRTSSSSRFVGSAFVAMMFLGACSSEPESEPPNHAGGGSRGQVLGTGGYWLYKDILAKYADAWQKDEIDDRGAKITYTGVATMAKITEFSKQYGGIMFWELSGDAKGEHSLYKAIQDAL